MKRVLVMATLALSGFLPSSTMALDFNRLAWREPTAIDSLRDRARVARYEENWDLARTLQVEILNLVPGDGFALMEFAHTCWSSGELPHGDASIELDSMPMLEGIHLNDAQREFLLAALLHDQYDAAGSLTHLEKAIQLAPNWVWARLRRAIEQRHLCAPWATYEPDVQAALEDADTAPKVLEFLVDPHDLDWPGTSRQDAERLVGRLATIPWTSEVPDYFRAWKRLEEGPLAAATYDSLLADLEMKQGPRSPYWLEALIVPITYDLPPRQALDLLDRRVANRFPTRWRVERARLMAELGWDVRAESLLVAAPVLGAQELSLLLRLSDNATADVLAKRSRQLLRVTRSSNAASLAGTGLDDLGRNDEAEQARNRAQAADPTATLYERFSTLVWTDMTGAQSLYDSLQAIGAAHQFVNWVPLTFAEVRGDTIQVESLLAGLPRTDTPDVLEWLSGLALRRGDSARSSRLGSLAIALRPNSVDLLTAQFERALSRDDLQTADSIVKRLEAVDPDCPTTLLAAVRLHAHRGERSPALAAIRRAFGDPVMTPSAAAMLTRYASSLGEPGLADSCMVLAAATGPDQPVPRLTNAWLHVQRRDLNPARTLLTSLVREFPGREEYRSLLLEAGGRAQYIPSLVRHEEEESPLERFAYDLDSIDWIQSRRVDPDSAPGQSAVVLQERTSYVGTEAGRYHIRQRLIVQFITRDAIADFQPYRIDFAPDQGAPRIRLARVIHADGRVAKVSLADVVISGASDEESDVSDALQAAIPFPDLVPGSILDLVYDSTRESFFEAGWSWRQPLVTFTPTREMVLEVLRRADFQISQGPGVPEPVTITDPPYVTSTWTMSNLVAPVFEEDAPDPIGQLPWVGCSSYQSWTEAARSYSDNFWGQATLSDSLRGVVRTLVKGARTPGEKLQRIYTHVTEGVQYLAIELDRGSIIPTAASEVLRRGYGDCKDMVVLLLAMLSEAGIEAQPVLVTLPPAPLMSQEFVEMQRFTHVVAWLPQVDSGVFCDPTTGARRAVEIDPEYCDRLALAMPRGRPATLIRIPTPSSDRIGFRLELDIEPLSDEIADIRVRNTLTGPFATKMRAALATADTTWLGQVVDRFLGYGLWWAERRSWQVEKEDMDTITLAAVYRDSAWASEHQKTISMQLLTEVADPYLAYPAAKDRKSDVFLPYPFKNHIVIRLHPGAGWLPSGEIADVEIQREHYSGHLKVRVPKKIESDPVEIEQEFDMRQREISVADYQIFHRDWERFGAVAAQPLRYRKVIQPEVMARLEKYAQEHPDDYAFSINAAQTVLGSDAGGEGEFGIERRRIARTILASAASAQDAGPMPVLWLAFVESKDGHYVLADSLYSEALKRDPSNALCLGMAIGSKFGMGAWEEEVDLLKTVIKTSGRELPLLELISRLYSLDREDEARELVERYFVLHADGDSSQVLLTTMRGMIDADHCERAATILSRLEAVLPKEKFRHAQLSHCMECAQWEQAVVILEDMHGEDPIDPVVCNNLAWMLARLGRDLDRAEELARTSIILSKDRRSAGRNTLGAVLARQGRWEEARGVFQTAFDEDDRPPSRAINEYFIGLCDYQMGDRASAVEHWKGALGRHPEPRYRRYIEDSLTMASEGGDVTRSMFSTEVVGR